MPVANLSTPAQQKLQNPKQRVIQRGWIMAVLAARGEALRGSESGTPSSWAWKLEEMVRVEEMLHLPCPQGNLPAGLSPTERLCCINPPSGRKPVCPPVTVRQFPGWGEPGCYKSPTALPDDPYQLTCTQCSVSALPTNVAGLEKKKKKHLNAE